MVHQWTWKCPGRGLWLISGYIQVRGDMKKDVNNNDDQWGSNHHFVFTRVKLCMWQNPIQQGAKTKQTGDWMTNGGKLKAQPFLSHCRMVPTLELQYVAWASTTSCGQKQSCGFRVQAYWERRMIETIKFRKNWSSINLNKGYTSCPSATHCWTKPNCHTSALL